MRIQEGKRITSMPFENHAVFETACTSFAINWNEKNALKLNSREDECIPLFINSFFGSMIRDVACTVLVRYLLRNTNKLQGKISGR